MQLRNAKVDDSEMLFNWANDAQVRAMAFTGEALLWEFHDLWYRNKLNDPNSRIYILIDDEQTPVGQIRFDINSDCKAEVDVHTKQGLRGQGIGKKIIQFGTEQLFKDSEALSVQATIKQENSQSIYAFTNAGYQTSGKEIIDGVPCCHMLKIKT